ncbi:hypothetical protein [Cohnella zeiphila]|uniref:Uncharacterized protein n=1 Tax=Cohnella zeiphila TaxID=2761120 RepID=A0A7X0SN26_9BACL|nr:hypothetical protein [Cohnella zeiphila]MBB6731909.1 hypothetical protein [Cohnella zeiphila]
MPDNRIEALWEKSKPGRVIPYNAGTLHELMGDIRYLLQQNEQLEQRNEEKYQILLRIEKEVNEFVRLTGVELGDTVEEQAAAFNRVLQQSREENERIREERDSFQRVGIRTMEERDDYRKALTQYAQGLVDPHLARRILSRYEKGESQIEQGD